MQKEPQCEGINTAVCKFCGKSQSPRAARVERGPGGQTAGGVGEKRGQAEAQRSVRNGLWPL